MVHRSPEDSPIVEEEPAPRKFTSFLSRKNSSESSGYYQEEFIFYRPPEKDYFEGPFSELQCQYWYKEGCFYNGLEFKFGSDGPIETLESLKTRNGRECPFQNGYGKPPSMLSSSNELMMKTLLGRVIDLADEIEKLKEERNAIQLSRKLEIDSLTNRVKQLMEKDTENDQYRRETELQLSEMQAEIMLLKEGAAASEVLNTAIELDITPAAPDEPNLAFIETRSISEKTAVDVSVCEDVNEVRNELERLQNSIHSLDKFTFKLSHKVEKLRHKYKVVNIIGEGLNNRNGVFDRLAYLEDSVEAIQAAMESAEEGKVETEEEKDESSDGSYPLIGEDIVLPMKRENGEERLESDGSVPDEWYSPSEKFSSSHSDPIVTAASFAAASESIAAAATEIWPAPEEMLGESLREHLQADCWNSIDEEEADLSWKAIDGDGMATPPTLETTVDVATGDVDKENVDMATEGAKSSPLDLIGQGLALLLDKTECGEIAGDADIDRLTSAIKGAKMLQIAESLKHHFGKALICNFCSTGAKKVEMRNAIEYFEHLNRAHFKKIGGADRTLVNQYAYLLEQFFKAAIPVPISISKKQYADREKNKPWLKRDSTSPNGKANGKKKK